MVSQYRKLSEIKLKFELDHAMKLCNSKTPTTRCSNRRGIAKS